MKKVFTIQTTYDTSTMYNQTIPIDNWLIGVFTEIAHDSAEMDMNSRTGKTVIVIVEVLDD